MGTNSDLFLGTACCYQVWYAPFLALSRRININYIKISEYSQTRIVELHLRKADILNRDRAVLPTKQS